MADIDNTEGTAGTEEIELEEITQVEDDDEDEVEETNLDDNEDLEWDPTDDTQDESISVPQGFNPDLGDIPEAPRGLKRVFTRDRKIFLKNALNVSLNMGDGQTLLYYLTTSS